MKKNTTLSISTIITKASTMRERLLYHYGYDDRLIESYLNKLHKVLYAENDPERLNKYLKWSNIDLATLSITKTIKKIPQSRWASFFEEVHEIAKNYKGFISPNSDNNSSVPFEELLMPFVTALKKRVFKRIDYLQPTVKTDIERQLLSLLSTYSSPTFYSEFQLFCVLKRKKLGRLEKSLPKETSTYSEFVDYFYQTFEDFYTEYPVLARVLSTVTLLFIETLLEFFERLNLDLPEFAGKFDCAISVYDMDHLRLGLSDPHNGRRIVIKIEFESGFKLVYKPKDLSVEEAFLISLNGLTLNQICSTLEL